MVYDCTNFYIGSYEVRKFILFGGTTTDRKPLAIPAGIEPAISSVTGWRNDHLYHGTILTKFNLRQGFAPYIQGFTHLRIKLRPPKWAPGWTRTNISILMADIRPIMRLPIPPRKLYFWFMRAYPQRELRSPRRNLPELEAHTGFGPVTFWLTVKRSTTELMSQIKRHLTYRLIWPSRSSIYFSAPLFTEHKVLLILYDRPSEPRKPTALLFTESYLRRDSNLATF